MKISLEISVWLLTTLLATGICLQCERCESATRSCSGPLQTCKEPQSACLTLTVETRVGKTRKVATYKGCTKLEYCPPGPFTVTTTPEERIRGNSECCCQDHCNKGALRLPLLSEPNQRWCPPRNLRGSTCTIGDKVFCHGSKNETFVRRGCGTQHICTDKLGISGIPGLFLETLTKADCNQANEIDDSDFTELSRN
ncbi:phospholipase A2 inhibitor and Ly6/PLAUR domain-containing protein-like isoform X2 [Podarcis muralis]